MAKLITGGTGYVGAELAHLLVERGEEVVLFDIVINDYRVDDIKDKIKVVRGDLGNWSEVLSVVKDNKITDIYHLGSMLSYMSELNPWASFRANVIGTYNVLEAARLFGVNRMMFASSGATFGYGRPEIITDTTLQRPSSFYGCGKLYCEGLGRWFRNELDLDFRCIRLANMIGPNVRTPGHWAPLMIEDTIMGRSHECIYATPKSAGAMIYLTDAARAADMILQAPKENIQMVNYCVASIPDAVSAEELETILIKRYPRAKIAYKKDPAAIAEVRRRSIPIKRFDDSYARKEWGWKPLYTTFEAIIEQFEKDIKDHPRRFGLT
ncbi:NAD-dependent epimerase/dehydratase family protein [Chloroflexota bacterium]